MGRGGLTAVALALGPGVALAQGGMGAMPGMGGDDGMAAESPPPAACAALDKDLPSALAAWTDKAPLAAAASPGALAAAGLAPGKAFSVSLRRTPEIRYPTQPEKPGGTVSYGGLLGLEIKAAGTYRIALGAGPWIDVLRDGAPVTSSAHGHGPACSSVRKMVDFPLSPGRYVVEVSAAAEPTLAVMVARLP